MFLVDRPRFDRHPLDDRFTRLWCGDRLIVNALEACDWERGRFGAMEWPPDEPFHLDPDDPTGVADVVRLGDSLALVPPAETWIGGDGWEYSTDFTEPFGGPLLFPPAAWRAVAWRAIPPVEWGLKALKHVAIRPPTRSQLLRAWLAGAPDFIRYAPDRSRATGTPHLAVTLRNWALAADPGTLEDALAACGRLADWVAAAPSAPAPGTLDPPGRAFVTLYLDGERGVVLEWPALAAPLEGGGDARPGLRLGDRAFRTGGGW